MSQSAICECCKIAVGKANLVWDHCHRCGTNAGFRGWICNDCNTALSQHLIDNLDAATRYINTHNCVPSLFDVTYTRSVRPHEGMTRRLYIGNGAGDRRYVMVPSKHLKRLLTVEQMAVAMGVAAGTARDSIHGRRSKRGVTIKGTHFIEYETAHQILKERWQL